MKSLKEMNDLGVTIIIVSHDMDIINQCKTKFFLTR